MQTASNIPQTTRSDLSDQSQEVSSDSSSYSDRVTSKLFTSQVKQVLPSNANDLNELSTTNFHFEVEESFLPQTKPIQNHQPLQNVTQSKHNSPSKTTDLIDQNDDQLDLKELLQILQDTKQHSNPPQIYPQNQKTNQHTRPSKQVKVHNQHKKYKQPHKKDNPKITNSEFLPSRQKIDPPSFNSHHQNILPQFNSHHPNILPQNHMPFQPPIYYPPSNQWQQYRHVQPYQAPYFQKPIIPYQDPMTIKSSRDDFASQNFVFWNVLISIKLCSFLSLKKNVFVAPFSSTNLDDKISRVITKRLKYNIREILYVEASKNNQKEVQDGYVFSVKAKGLEKNYRGIYFLKSPPLNWSEGMKYYSVGMLKQSVKKIFELVHEHMEKDIVFPDFEWGSLNQNELCENLIWSIFREINEQRKNYKCMALKEVIISVNSCENFELYSKYLKCYVQKLRG